MTRLHDTIAHLKTNGTTMCHFIYDLPALHKHVQAITASLPANCDMYYAMKANSETSILAALSEDVTGFEVASQGEIAKGLAHKSAQHIIFGGPGKTDDELIYAIDQGIQRIHVESIYELQRLNALLTTRQQQMKVLLRVNLAGPFPNATLHMAGRPTQFGISEDQIDAAIALALELPYIQLEGFHFHSISNNLDAQLHVEMMRLYFQKAKAWAHQHGFTLHHLNLGGGIGVNYADLTQQFDWQTFVDGFHQVIDDEAMHEVSLNFECGRYLVAHIGYYVTEVLDIKRVHQAYYAILKGGTQQFRLPVSWQHNHPFEIYPVSHNPYAFERISVAQKPVTFVGQLCTPKDVLAKDITVPTLTTGDVIIFNYAGAYGWSISHHDFLSHPHPTFIYLTE
ncbi:type III PLP-dependent enzyme [Staphylococcus arlettae]|uniref:type III PLP-dependent enzyme n=1 Tax=Staphylococcus arlettae TaxID=29378 RepID=UPI001BDD3B75|nr:type III PLP-dependent enzyme [Staphylococcus arlettae]MCD8816208.1 type III PLP-dependent enzyme [Staphylococcus arlettae]MCD8833835.1 type III PLP-dependent enzyme [Staphylococcus arlettae]QZZ03684.1 type III PLP-dependent enzyme [Staphylococcus arlettae]